MTISKREFKYLKCLECLLAIFDTIDELAAETDFEKAVKQCALESRKVFSQRVPATMEGRYAR